MITRNTEEDGRLLARSHFEKIITRTMLVCAYLFPFTVCAYYYNFSSFLKEAQSGGLYMTYFLNAATNSTSFPPFSTNALNLSKSTTLP